MILERLGARRWVPIIMVAWGGATLSLAFITTPLEFYVIRFFIGFAEAGFFPFLHHTGRTRVLESVRSAARGRCQRTP